MTFVGKILVLVNLVMSFIFMAFAVMVQVSRDDLRNKLAEKEQAVQTAQKAKADAESEKANLQKTLDDERAEWSNEKTTYDEKINQVEQRNDALQQQVAKALDEANQATAALKISTAEQEQRTNEVKQLYDARDALLQKNSELTREKTALTDQLAQKSNELEVLIASSQDLEQRHQRLTAYVARMNDGVVPAEEELAAAGELPPPPDVEGIVTEVDRGGRFIQISLGSDDGIRKGHELELWRTDGEALYLGKIKVFTVNNTSSVAQPLSLTGIVQRNDRVGPRIIR